jgi:hypothetical protein
MRNCVKVHLRPEKNADEITKANPMALKDVSAATIITTPTVIAAMTKVSLIDGVSKRKIKAKRRTKARENDLQIVRNVREINLKDIFPKPISRDPAIPQGKRKARYENLAKPGAGGGRDRREGKL